MYAWAILCCVCLQICTRLAFTLAILFHFPSNTSTHLMHSTPPKLAEDGITAYTLSSNLPTETLTAFSLLITPFRLLNTYSQPP